MFRAAGIWLGPGRVRGPVRLRIAPDGRIAAIEPESARRAPPELLLPAMVDAHVHLQLGRIPAPRGEFADWLTAVARDGRRADRPARARRLQAHLQQLAAEGTRAVGEIDPDGSSQPQLAHWRGTARCYRELLGIDLDARGAATLLEAAAARAPRGALRGWSPHAPYSVSLPLLRAAAATGQPMQIHLAESEAELEFLARGTGPLREMLARLGKRPLRAPFRGTPLGWVAAGRALQRRTTLVHCQHLAPGDARRIRAAGASIVVCPGTIRWFARTPPPVAEWLALGIPVGLGTDSRASNTQLSMRRELAVARKLWPQLRPGDLLQMATRHGARALHVPRIGRLRAGAIASWIRLPWPSGASVGDLEEAFTAGEAAALPADDAATPGDGVETLAHAT